MAENPVNPDVEQIGQSYGGDPVTHRARRGREEAAERRRHRVPGRAGAGRARGAARVTDVL
jgi:hypothetical protein